MGSYVINEIKESDRYSGGSTLIGYIDNDGFQRLSEDKILSYHKTLVEAMTTLFKEGAKEISEEAIKKMLAKP